MPMYDVQFNVKGKLFVESGSESDLRVWFETSSWNDVKGSMAFMDKSIECVTVIGGEESEVTWKSSLLEFQNRYKRYFTEWSSSTKEEDKELFCVMYKDIVYALTFLNSLEESLEMDLGRVILSGIREKIEAESAMMDTIISMYHDVQLMSS